MVKVDKALALHLRELDVGLRGSSIPALGGQYGAQTRDNAARIAGMLLQVLVDQRRGFRHFACENQLTAKVVRPQRWIRRGRDLSHDSQSFVAAPLKESHIPKSQQRKPLIGIERERFLQFLDGFVQQPDMGVDHTQMMVCRFQIRVERQRALIFAHRLLVREHVGGPPE